MPLDVDAVDQSTLYARTVYTVLASNRSFSRFHQQVEHNASLFQYVMERVLSQSVGKDRNYFLNKQVFCTEIIKICLKKLLVNKSDSCS